MNSRLVLIKGLDIKERFAGHAWAGVTLILPERGLPMVKL